MLRWASLGLSSLLTFVFLWSTGCSSAVLPDKPFYVVWNHPSQGCYNYHIPFEKFGIVDNAKDRFIGEKIALFYGLGAWPNIRKDGSFYNGGIPQRANLTRHYDKVRRDLQKHVPDKDFSGLGVIDMESWRPIYVTDYSSLRKYQYESKKHVKARFPKLTSQQQNAKAQDEWNEAARKMMEETLKLVTKLRPNGKWGYYGYPRPWINDDATVRINDRQSYIWNISTGIYPSIYFNLGSTPAGRQNSIKAKISESLRVRNKFSHRDTPILPYTLSQNGRHFSESELKDSIGLPAEMGASGVVIWGSSSEFHVPHACQLLKNHITNVLGPYVLKLTNFFGNCSEQLCHGNGRCVRKDFVKLHRRELETSRRETQDGSDSSGSDSSSSASSGSASSGSASSGSDSSGSDSSGSWERPDSAEDELSSIDQENVSIRGASVGYNFDDYACSCYANWEGSRCDAKQ